MTKAAGVADGGRLVRGGRWIKGVGVALALAALAVPALGGNKASDKTQGVSDAEVVASMKKGIDFLLSQKKGDSWESGKKWNDQTRQTGGETALVLYALLHASHSLLDDTEYSSKLNPRTKEMASAIEWLSKNNPDGTYTAGLQACALALTTKRKEDKNTEGPKLGLEASKNYLLAAFGSDGGYGYVIPKTRQSSAEEHKQLSKALDDARGKLNDAEKNMRTGATKEVDKKDDKGNVIKGNDGKALKEKVQKTREELEQDIKSAQLNMEKATVALQNAFKPIGDLSNAQYATLGMWALADYGIELPTDYWKTSDRFWRLTQLPSGCWPYNVSKGDSRDTMGLAGLASLFITADFVDTTNYTSKASLIPKPDPHIERGLAWLNKSFKASTGDYYYLYGVERVGLSTGLKFFGTTNWYKEGAANIINRQAGDGSWSGGFHGAEKTVATSYALMFLARGRNPVVFNKLAYEGPWNARPRDNANITRWMSKKFEKPINWQIVNLQVKPEEWLDAPVLLITGSQDPKFTAEDLEKIRAYINAGGMVFSTADDASKAFTDAMVKYATAVVDKKYEMRELPKNHGLFTGELWAPLKNPPRMLGMSNGVRDIWIHSPVDMGVSWQMRRDATAEHYTVPANIFFYATGKGSLRSKLAPLAVLPSSAAPTQSLAMARVDHVANCDPEPGAWVRMAKLAQADFRTDLQLSTVKWVDLDAKKYKLAHLTGTTRFTLTDADAAAVKAYIAGGGMLFADASGGSADFGESVMLLMKKLYPDQAPQRLGVEHPLIAGTMTDGEDATKIEFRKYGVLKLGQRLTSPQLDAVMVEGRIAILFSPYDITSGLLGTQTWGITGYAPDSAQAIARNVLLYAMNRPMVNKAAGAPREPDKNATASK